MKLPDLTQVANFVGNLRGYRKMLVMVLILATLSGLLVFSKLTGPEFIDALKFISTAFFAANLGGKIAGNSEVKK